MEDLGKLALKYAAKKVNDYEKKQQTPQKKTKKSSKWAKFGSKKSDGWSDDETAVEEQPQKKGRVKKLLKKTARDAALAATMSLAVNAAKK